MQHILKFFARFDANIFSDGYIPTSSCLEIPDSYDAQRSFKKLCIWHFIHDANKQSSLLPNKARIAEFLNYALINA
jgi:hypothetical protein